MNRKEQGRWNLSLILGSVLALGVEVTPVKAQTISMVADNNTHAVTVFNADTDTVLGTVDLPDSGFANEF